MEIRQITENDFEKAIECIQKSVSISNGPDYPEKVIQIQLTRHYTVEWLKETFHDRYCVVAIEGDTVQGTGTLVKNELRNIFVDPDCQKQGIGRKIMAHLEKVAKQNKFTDVFLMSSITARGFYPKLGYKEENKITHEIGDDVVVGYLMKKELT